MKYFYGKISHTIGFSAQYEGGENEKIWVYYRFDSIKSRNKFILKHGGLKISSKDKDFRKILANSHSYFKGYTLCKNTWFPTDSYGATDVLI